jgi:hypothetical protein
MSEQAEATTCARIPGVWGREAPAAHGWREGDPVRSPPYPRQSMPNEAVSPWCTKTDDEPTFYGELGIPETWPGKLAHRALIQSFADQLFQLSRTL